MPARFVTQRHLGALLGMLIAILPLETACGLGATTNIPANTTPNSTSSGGTPTPTTSSGTPNPSSGPAASATFRIGQGSRWQPPSVRIGLAQSVAWENVDPTTAHGVICDQQASGDGTCPWAGTLSLAPAQRDTSGNITPSRVVVTFKYPGIYTIRDAGNSSISMQVVVGAP